MSVTSLLEMSIDSIRTYKRLIDNHKSNKDYGNDIVSSYNVLGDNIEALSEEIEEIFSNDDLYNKHFESDEIQDNLSNQLNIAFDEYELHKDQKRCEEKIALAYEWLFEVMLFTMDDEELKSKITLNNNDISMQPRDSGTIGEINEKSVVSVKVQYDGKTEDLSLVVEEIVDDYLYCYLGDKENEEDLVIFSIDKVFSVK